MTRILCRLLTSAAALAAGLSGVACGADTESGRASTAPPPSASTPQSSSTQPPSGQAGVPPVLEPLNAEPFASRPCATISGRLLGELGLPETGVPKTEGAVATIAGPSCAWNSEETLSTSGVALLVGNKNGLADTYRNREQRRVSGYFEETTVGGHPGVFTSGNDFRQEGMCTLVFGATDTLAIQVTEQGQLGAGSCDRVVRVAVAVIRTLKGEG